MRNSLLCALASLVLSASAVAQGGEHPPYEPRPFEIPKHASYLLPDGSIQIVGNDGMEEILKQFNALFAKAHPGVKFKMLLEGSSTGIGGLIAGVSPFAPMGRGGWPTDMLGFREAYGYPPFDIHVGYDGFVRPKHKSPPAVYVHAKNPLAGLTMEQLARIMTAGQPRGDITRWKQLGLTGEWAKRGLHVFGQPDTGAAATAMRHSKFGGVPFTRDYEELDAPCDVVKAVSQDPFSIGLAGYCEAAAVSRDVKVVPLAWKAGDPYAVPSYEDIHAGRYPLVDYLHFYVNRRPGTPLDPFVREYLRLVLSREGQAIIAAQRDSEEGFIPLTPEAAAAERAKLD